ncbi:5'-methylthioadenosine phosphorylase [alpha proteobacterium BAL199]|nr:5'-methylthioadenosine phosphorylase [alpha proteobacterium BAL199]
MPTVSCNSGLTFEIIPQTTALLVIDLQRDFLDPDGFIASYGDDISTMRSIIPNAVALIQAARAADTTVIHTREGYAPDLSDMHAMKRERGVAGRSGPLGRFLIRGEAGHAHIAECRPSTGELIVDKPGFGSFYRTDLEQVLNDRGIDRLILFGVTTQCCVSSTLREAVDRGLRCLTVEDACAATTPELHNAAIQMIYGENNLFGWVSDAARVLAALTPLPT